MDRDMRKELHRQEELLAEWVRERGEQGVRTDRVVGRALRVLQKANRRLERMEIPKDLSRREPEDLPFIRAFRPEGPRRMPLDAKRLVDRIRGAWFGRAAGCVLGIPCEGMSRGAIERAARTLGEPYPLERYWKKDPKFQEPSRMHYGRTERRRFLLPDLDRIGADDDMIYTIIGLLVLEKHGRDFTTEQIGRLWVERLPVACTAEQVAIENLKAGLRPPATATAGNPYCEWIGADIRSDAWAYAAPGMPELAAEFAYRDASLSHRWNGVYGEMFFSAAISAAFSTGDVEEALETGLTEIPAECRLALAVRETIDACRKDGSWEKTHDAIAKRYRDMHHVHTINNACITIMGLLYGEGDFGRTIGLTVMGGLDTDCTAATAGSLFGAAYGLSAVPARWRKPLGDRVETYIKDLPDARSSDICRRFTKIAAGLRGDERES